MLITVNNDLPRTLDQGIKKVGQILQIFPTFGQSIQILDNYKIKYGIIILARILFRIVVFLLNRNFEINFTNLNITHVFDINVKT